MAGFAPGLPVPRHGHGRSMSIVSRIGRLPLLVGGLALGGCQMSGLAGLDAAFGTRDVVRRAEPQRQQMQALTPKIYLIRGIARPVSAGVDQLAAKLNERGYRTSIHTFDDWRAIVEEIAADQRASRGRQKAIVIGHSLGANATLSVVNALASRGLQVPLAVTFDPTVPLALTGGAGRLVNFYQSNNGWGRPIAAATGQERRLENIDLRAADNLTHFTIDQDDQIHQRIFAWIRQSAGPGNVRLAQTPRRIRG